LQDEAVSVRRAAAALLGWLRDPAAQAGLIGATADEDAEVRRIAIGAILPGGPETDTAFARAFDDENWLVREEAATRAGRIKLEATLPALIARMQDDYWQVRVKAAASLGQLKLAEAIPALAAALAVPISNLRKEATAALGEIGHRDALPHLAAYADDPDPDVRKLNRWASTKIQAG
jgi:HEAT repeat protein